MLFRITFLVLCLSALSACDDSPSAPAPMGELAVLEQLADAYREVAENYPVQPQAMRPKGRMEFIQQVFRTAGYDYTATLLAMAHGDVDTSNQYQRDLADLVLLPQRGLSDSQIKDLYSGPELEAIYIIKNNFR